MQEAVSSILIGRRREVDGLNRMVLLSLAAHAAVLAALVFVPRDWLTSAPPAQEKPMMISMDSVRGQNTGGMTAIAARPVQAVTPPEAKPVVTQPATKTPEMVAPTPEPPKPVAKPVTKPLDKATARKPTTGPQVRTGDARVETGGAEVPFGGLASSSAGGTGGARVEGDFCCPEYIETMKQLIYNNWNQHQGTLGQVEVKFTIRRDGMIVNSAIEKTSNNPLLDLESRRAVVVTQKLPALPDRFTRPTLTVYLLFEYKR